MKSLSSLFVLGMVVGLSAQNAHAWGKKLDLNAIQGKYDIVIKPMMPLGCPETITVVYDEKNATLDSEAFHFSNIDGKAQDLAPFRHANVAHFKLSGGDVSISHSGG